MTTDEHTDPSSYRKKRKIAQRACDNCRRKKIRCNEAKPPHNKCLGCIEHDLDCTYEEIQKKRGRTSGYVEGLEQRVQILEVVLKKLCPDETTLYNLISPLDPKYAASLTSRPVTTDVSSFMPPTDSSPTEAFKEVSSSSAVLNIIQKIAALTLGSQDDPFRDEEDLEQIDIASRVKSSIPHKHEDIRFWGKSSGATFVLTAILAKDEYAKDAPVKRKILQGKRPIFWRKLPWVKDPIHNLPSKYTFPPPDLITKLTVAYFEHVNLFYPLLHRPTFERAVANNLHYSDGGFGSVLLLVCAVGSQYLEKIDPRTLADGEESPLSAGWKWYSQVSLVKLRLLEPPTLYEIQSYCLAVHFLTGSYSPQAVWVLVGLGIRLAQELGVHRWRIRREMLTVEDELWKRAFWVLVAMDRMISMGIGRQCAIFDDHFDLDMPVECDDEYWEHPDPKKRFVQPEGVPCTVTAFNHLMRLNKIMTFTLNTIYSLKTKFWESILEKWEQHIVAELDSAMNNWIGSLPEYLRWDPNRTDDRFFRLSGSLVAYYYHIQILIHRRFIRTRSRPSPLAYPSLAICNNAARSCSVILEQEMKRNVVVYPHMQMAAVPAAIVLLLNTWGSKRSGLTADKDMAHVEQCMNVLKKSEERWHSAGQLLDVLNELVSFGGFVWPEHGPGQLADPALERSKMRACLCSGFQERSASTEKQQDISEPSFLDESVPLSPERSNELNPTSQHTNDFSNLNLTPEYSALPTASATSYIPNNVFGTEFPLPEHWTRNQPYDSESYNLVSAGYPTFDDMPSDVAMSPFENITSNSNSAFSEQQAIVDNNTMAMWLTAPAGFELNEWNAFVTNFTEIANELGDLNQLDSTRGS